MAAPKTYSAMLRHIDQLSAQAESMRVRESAGVIKRIQDAMIAYNLTAEDLVPKPKVKKQKVVAVKKVAEPKAATSKGVARPIKYADDKGNKWSGGGSTPVWLREQVAAGKSIEDFAINRPSPT